MQMQTLSCRPHRLSLLVGAVAPAALVLGLSADAGADVLVQYTMEDSGGRLSPTTEAEGVDATNLTRDSQNPSSSWGALDRPESNLSSFEGITTTGSPEVSEGTQSGYVVRRSYLENGSTSRYVQFGLESEDPLSPLELESVRLDAGKGGNGTRSFSIAFSTDGWATSTMLGGATFSNGVPEWTFANFEFDLTPYATLQSLAGSVSFRLFGDVPSDNNQMGFDNITVNGGAIPEPASLALAGLGLVTLLGRGRR